MLKTFAIAMLAIGMSVGLAQAKGSKQKAPSPRQTEQQANANMHLRTSKNIVPKGAMVPRLRKCLHAVAGIVTTSASFEAAIWRPLCVAH